MMDLRKTAIIMHREFHDKSAIMKLQCNFAWFVTL